MRHGLTLGEVAAWFVKTLKLDVDYRVIGMEGWRPEAAPGYGWPLGERIWINPSPNAPNLGMARSYAGTVMVEGTTLSEGRGTTRPLEMFGAPDIDALRVMAEMATLAPAWLAGCRLREVWFEPTFHKHIGKLCHGVLIHAEGPSYDHAVFRPWRLQAVAFKAIRRLYPDYSAVARFRLRVRNGPARHRCHQRRPGRARMGGRRGGDAGRSRRAGSSRRAGLGGRAAGVPALLSGRQSPDDRTPYAPSNLRTTFSNSQKIVSKRP